MVIKRDANLDVLLQELTAAIAKPEAEMLRRALPQILSQSIDCEDQAVDCLVKVNLAAAIVDKNTHVVLVNGLMLDMFAAHNKAPIHGQYLLADLRTNFPQCYFFCVPICNSISFPDSQLLVSYSQVDMLAILADHCNGLPLTATEVKVLIGLINGWSLKQIAERDQVSYETRRHQFKQILTKFNQVKNTELIALVLTHVHGHLFSLLLNQLNLNKAPPVESPSVTFFKEIYGQSLRVHYLASDDYRLTVFDLGPVDGDPVLCMHPINMPIYPISTKTNVLYELNQRIICPAMPGYCGSGPVTGLDVAPYCAAIDDFLIGLGVNKCAMLSVHTGVHMATEFIAATQIQLQSIVYINCYLTANRGFPSQGISKLTRGFWSMVRRYPATLFKPVLRIGMSLIKNKASLRRGYIRMYKDCPIDYPLALEILEDPGFVGMYRLIEDCEDGFFACLNRANQAWHDKLDQMGVPITLVYGDSDPHKGQAEIEQWGLYRPQIKLVKLHNSAVLDAYVRPRRVLELLNVKQEHRRLTAIGQSS